MKFKYTKTSNDNWQIDLVSPRLSESICIAKIARSTFDPGMGHMYYELEFGERVYKSESLEQAKNELEDRFFSMVTDGLLGCGFSGH